MQKSERLFSEKTIHLAFSVSLWLKGVFALTEVIGGIAGFFVSTQILNDFAVWVTRSEVAEDPHDIIANFFLHAVQHLTSGTLNFAAIYLLGHGIVKLWLIIGLLRRRLGYYPVAIVVFGLFIAYQLYRYTLTHSIWLVLITLLDLVVIGLTWHEYRYLKAEKIRV